jgi:predicted transcriptional regulator
MVDDKRVEPAKVTQLEGKRAAKVAGVAKEAKAVRKPVPRRGKQAADSVLAREREKVAIELRKSGATYEAIGDQLGVSAQAAHQHVQRALKRIIDETNETADEVRTIELQRLDRALQAIWRRVLQGDVHAIDRSIRIMERRAKLLGLDAPTKVEAEVGPVQIEVVRVPYERGRPVEEA